MERHDVRKFRDRHGLTQSQLAQKVGVSPRSVRRWETTGINPSDGAHSKLQSVRDEMEAKMNQPPAPADAKPTRRPPVPPGKGAPPAGLSSGPKRRVAHLPGDQQGERTLAPLAAVLPSMGRVAG